jgi:hypothetical protein
MNEDMSNPLSLIPTVAEPVALPMIGHEDNMGSTDVSATIQYNGPQGRSESADPSMLDFEKTAEFVMNTPTHKLQSLEAYKNKLSFSGAFLTNPHSGLMGAPPNGFNGFAEYLGGADVADNINNNAIPHTTVPSAAPAHGTYLESAFQSPHQQQQQQQPEQQQVQASFTLSLSLSSGRVPVLNDGLLSHQSNATTATTTTTTSKIKLLRDPPMSNHGFGHQGHLLTHNHLISSPSDPFMNQYSMTPTENHRLLNLRQAQSQDQLLQDYNYQKDQLLLGMQQQQQHQPQHIYQMLNQPQQDQQQHQQQHQQFPLLDHQSFDQAQLFNHENKLLFNQQHGLQRQNQQSYQNNQSQHQPYLTLEQQIEHQKHLLQRLQEQQQQQQFLQQHQQEPSRRLLPQREREVPSLDALSRNLMDELYVSRKFDGSTGIESAANNDNNHEAVYFAQCGVNTNYLGMDHATTIDFSGLTLNDTQTIGSTNANNNNNNNTGNLIPGISTDDLLSNLPSSDHPLYRSYRAAAIAAATRNLGQSFFDVENEGMVSSGLNGNTGSINSLMIGSKSYTSVPPPGYICKLW